MNPNLPQTDWKFVQNSLEQLSKSRLGQALASGWQPFPRRDAALNFLSRVTEASRQLKFARTTQNAVSLQTYLADLSDPSACFERAEKDAVLDPIELWAAALFIEGTTLFAVELRKMSTLCPLLARDFEGVPPTPPFCPRVRKSVNSLGEILDSASPELARLRADRASRRSELESKLESKVKDWHAKGLLQDKFYDYLEGRLVVPVKVEQQSKLDGILVSKSNTGQSVFVEPLELTPANNALKETELKIRAEEFRILRSLSTELSKISGSYRSWIVPIAEADLAFAAAELAASWMLNAPRLETPPNRLKLPSFFHPRLGPSSVKNSLELHPGGHAFLISGPNTGGKTVLIKAVATACDMARAGLFVPCDAGAEIPFYSGVYTLIGDEQDLSKGLSSFSGQIAEIRKVLDDGKGANLVVIDEILSSTDPEEASVLAQVVLEELAAKGHHILVTSHFSDLSIRAKAVPLFSVGAMEFDTSTKDPKPTFRLRPDELGSSHALEVATRLGIPLKMIERARGLMSKEKIEYQKARDELVRKEKILEADYSKRLLLLEEKNAGEVKKLQDELSNFLKTSRERVEKQIDDIKREYARGRAEQRARTRQIVAEEGSRQVVDRIEELAIEKFLHRKPEELEDGAEPSRKGIVEPGCQVRVLSLARSLGKVLEIKENGTLAVVQMGNFRLEKPMSDLVFHAAPVKSLVRTRVETPEFEDGKQLPTRLDLRGRRLDQALSEAERFLDQSVRSGRSSVVIITGHGTGAIKTAVKDLLTKLHYVQEFKGERVNDDGALIIEFTSN